MKLISNYRDNEILRTSFIELAREIFGLNFSSWHGHGYWGESYIPYSFADRDKIVANVSVNKLDFIIDGRSFRTLQIGTVMTHPDYRSKGLSASLMNHILEKYKDKYDFMYLFANDSVLNFYPKFGFKRAEEFLYSVKNTPETVGGSQYGASAFAKETNNASGSESESKSTSGSRDTLLRKLDISKPEDLQLVEKMVNERMPVSKVYATAKSGGITMYHVLNVFTDHLYYSEQEDAVVIFSKDDDTVHLFDVVSMAPVNIERILGALKDIETNKIVFHYTPDYKGLKYTRIPYQRDGVLFVKTNGGLTFPQHVKHPVTSEA